MGLIGFTTKVLSVGMLKKQGCRMSLDTPPYGFYSPSKEWVPVQEHDNLLFIDVEPIRGYPGHGAATLHLKASNIGLWRK